VCVGGVVTRGCEPYVMVVIVLLTLSTSAIAMPPFGPSLFPFRLQTRGGNKLKRSECCYPPKRW
jgi:hypothetical protein